MKGDILASTSPPRHSVVLPMPVRTTEQYWALLLTTSFSRFSMKSLDVSAQVFGNVDKVSNLYPEKRLVRITPKLANLVE